MIEEQYEALNRKYEELFSRTANLMKVQEKHQKSRQDLERTVTFMRAELSTKGALKDLDKSI